MLRRALVPLLLAAAIASAVALVGPRASAAPAGVPTVTEPQLMTRPGHAEVFKRFVDSILEGTPMSPSGEEGLDRVRLIEAIYRSAEIGREVDVEATEIDTGSAATREVAS